jgi:hypothetical protein
MKKTSKIIFTIILVTTIFSCSDDNPQLEIPKVTTVYVGGQENLYATIWKDGVAQKLPSNILFSDINSIYVAGNDVYAAGYTVETSIGYIAAIWKNGNIIFSKNSENSNVNSIFVANNIVYAVGYINDHATLWTLRPNATTFTETILSILSSNANSIYVVGTDIYISGSLGGESAIWKNNLLNDLGIHFFTPSTANAIFVNGTDVYVAGFNKAEFNVFTGTLKKNGVIQNTLVSNSIINSIASDGQNIYAAGGTDINTPNQRATVWKNNIFEKLNSLNKSYAKSVFATTTDVYVVGYETTNITVDSDRARVWKNGMLQELSTNNSYANSIFVTVK